MAEEEELLCILRLELENTQFFIDLLGREQAVLIEGNVERLSWLVAEKDRIVQQLFELGFRRDQYLATFGLPAGADGVKTWISRNQAAIRVPNSWNKLVERVHEAKRVSRENSVMVSSWLQHTRRTLSALQSATGQAMLYDPRGLAV